MGAQAQVLVVGATHAGNDAFTTLLLHADGVDGSVVFVDSSASAHPVVVTGSAQIDTGVSKFGSGSVFFPDDGVAAKLALDGTTGFNFGTGDFSIDFWLMWHDNGAGLVGSSLFVTQSTGVLVNATINNPTAGQLDVTINGTIRSVVLAADTWNHIAITRSGTSSRLFANGVQVGATISDSGNYGTGAGFPVISGNKGFVIGADFWFDEIRISKGIARWTANFTPPTTPYN